ncbi:DUF2000 domain-containing protein [Zarconia navalis]|nr:DUF2000 domain-containing protein [Zarconia navalis]
MYADNDSKFIAVLNRKIETPKLMNALGHMTVGLMAKLPAVDKSKPLKYEFEASWADPSLISLYPFILLAAKNNNQLKTLHLRANELGVCHNAFTDSMLGSSASEQQQQTKEVETDNLTYFGIVIFGATEQLTDLTRKYSLFKG